MYKADIAEVTPEDFYISLEIAPLFMGTWCELESEQLPDAL